MPQIFWLEVLQLQRLLRDLQGLVDARYKFLSADVGAFGRQSDSGVFSHTNLY